MKSKRTTRNLILPLLAIALIVMMALVIIDPFADEAEPYFYEATPLSAIDQSKPLAITIGDSIAAGWQDCRVEGACAGIQQDWWSPAIGAEVSVLNRGIGGSTSSELLARWGSDTANADLILVVIGVNDVARADVRPETLVENLQAMRRRALDAGILPIFSTILPADSTTPRGIEVAQVVNQELLALRDNAGWYVIDFASVMEDPTNPGRLRREHIAHDGSSHPNQAGYDQMTDTLREWWQTHKSEILAKLNNQ